MIQHVYGALLAAFWVYRVALVDLPASWWTGLIWGAILTGFALPADGNETSAGRRAALETDGPTALVLSRQDLPSLPTGDVDVAGAVIADGDDATVLATGSEVHVALEARTLLTDRGVAARVVSLPSRERFRARTGSEREALAPTSRPTVAVEAAASQGWHGLADHVVAVDRFGLSAPALKRSRRSASALRTSPRRSSP